MVYASRFSLQREINHTHALPDWLECRQMQARSITCVSYVTTIREFPARSITELLTVDGEICTSFQQSAFQRGLLADDREAMLSWRQKYITLHVR